MALSAGQCEVDPVTGLAGAIFNALQARPSPVLSGMLPNAFTPQGAPGSAERALLAALVESVSSAIVAHITANAVVHIAALPVAGAVLNDGTTASDVTGLSGLQNLGAGAPFSNTIAPIGAPPAIPGAVADVTVVNGTVTGTGTIT